MDNQAVAQSEPDLTAQFDQTAGSQEPDLTSQFSNPAKLPFTDDSGKYHSASQDKGDDQIWSEVQADKRPDFTQEALTGKLAPVAGKPHDPQLDVPIQYDRGGMAYRPALVPEAEGWKDPLIHIAAGAEPIATGLSRISENQATPQRAPVFGIHTPAAHERMADIGVTLSPEQQAEEENKRRQRTLGAAEVIEGSGQLGSVAVPAAVATAPLKAAAGFGAGYLASEGAGAAVHGKVAPEDEQLIRNASFFIPSAFGTITGLKTGSIETPAGKFSGASAFDGAVRAGVANTPEVLSGRVKVGGTQFEVNIPRRAPAPEPSEAAKMLGEFHQSTGETPTPPAPKPPPQFQGPDHLTPEVAKAVSQTIMKAPLADRPKLMLEAHQNMVRWMLNKGTFTGPDGKIYSVDNEGQAKKLASNFINDQVDAVEKEAEKQQAAANSQPAAKPEAQKQSKLPAYLKETIQQGHEQAQKLGIADQIEELSAQGLTAGQIAIRLKDKLTSTPPEDRNLMIRSTRAARGIPSQDNMSEFEEWRQKRAALKSLPTTAPVSGKDGGAHPMGKGMTQDSPAVEKVAQEANLTPGQEPLVMVKEEKPADVKKLAQPPKPVDPEELAAVGTKDKESGRTILQPSDDVLQNERMAAEGAPELATKLSAISANVPGAQFDRMRPQKNLGRITEKEDADKPPATIADYSAAQIAADSPQAKDSLIHELQKNFTVLSVEDKFTTGDKDLQGYPSVKVQVQLSNGHTSEVQIVPTEMQEVADHAHHFYSEGRKADVEGNTKKRDEMWAQSEKINTDALNKAKESWKAQGWEEGQEPDLMESIGGEPEQKFEKGSTQINIDPESELARVHQKAVDAIPDEHLMPTDFGGTAKGREDKPHVTVRYGLKDDSPQAIDKIKEAAAQIPPFEVPIGKTDTFPASVHSDGAVPVIARLETTPELRELRAAMEKAGDFHADTFPDYKPHITLAYVKPEFAAQYKGGNQLEGQKVPVNEITISKKDGTQEAIPLGGEPDLTDQMERRTNPVERKRVEHLTPEERAHELLTSELTGLPNKRAFAEDAVVMSESHPHVGYADIDDFKGFNTELGHEGVDEKVLPKIGEVFRRAAAQEPGGSLKVYHRSGDEFLFRSKDRAAIGRVVDRVNKELEKARFTAESPDGHIHEKIGAGLSHGTGKDAKSAEQAAGLDKQRRKEAGLRSGARDIPKRLGEESSEGKQADRVQSAGGPGQPQKPDKITDVNELHSRAIVPSEATAKADLSGKTVPPKAPTFFSKAERVVEDKLPKNVAATSVLSTLKNAGVKDDEIKWIGLDDFLKDRRMVSKQELLDFIRQNNVQVQEVMKGQGKGKVKELVDWEHTPATEKDNEYWESPEGYRVIQTRNGRFILDRLNQDDLESGVDNPYEQMGFFGSRHEAQLAAARDYHGESNSDAQYENYQLPGGKNYRELLLTLPERLDATPIQQEIEAKYGGDSQTAYEAAKNDAKEMQQKYGLYSSEAQAAWEKADAIKDIINRKQPIKRDETKQFISGHFSEPNILAHIRFNDRVDPDGKKILFLEEIQSDWHQQGRKQGYDTPEARAEFANSEAEEGRSSRTPEFVPDAPFKSTWHELALKRMLRYTAENGYDKLGWTTGEQQAERYDLSKHVKELYWQPDERILTAKMPDGGHQQLASDIDPAKLSDYIGKEAAAKIVQPGAKDISLSSDQDVHVLRGPDLKVGGQGMKGFYDKIIPDFLNKYGKKWRAKVGETNIATQPERDFDSFKQQHQRMYPNATPDQIKTAFDKNQSQTPVHSMDITPEMRKEVVFSGQTLYSGIDPIAASKAVAKTAKDVSGIAKVFFEKDLAPITKGVSGGLKEVVKLGLNVIAPRMTAPQQSLDVAMKMKGQREEERFRFERTMAATRKMFDQMSEADRVRFIDNIMRGRNQSSTELDEIAQMMRQVQERFRAMERPFLKENPETGERGTDKENYFHLKWKKLPAGVDEEGNVIEGTGGKQTYTGSSNRPLQGGRSFLKRKTLQDASEGIKRGGELMSTNPVDLLQHRVEESLKFTTARKAWEEHKSTPYTVDDKGRIMHIVQFFKKGLDRDARALGYEKLNDPIAKVMFPAGSGEGMIDAGEYWVEQNTARLYNNFLSRDRVRETSVGRGIVGIKNGVTAWKLGFSPFHAITESMLAAGSEIGRGYEHAFNQGVRQGSIAEVGRGLATAAKGVAAPVAAAREGGKAVQYVTDPEKFLETQGGKEWLKKYPEANELITDLFTGGAKLAMHEDFRMNALQGLRQSIADNNYIGAAFRSPMALNQTLQYPLFEVYIPRLKVGMFLREYSEALADRSDELESGKMNRAKLARDIWDGIDHRFGELNWDNFFWNRTFKTVNQLAWRAFSWTYGNFKFVEKAATGQAKEIWESGKYWKDAYDKTAGTEEQTAAPGTTAIPRLDRNMAKLMGMLTVAVAVHTALQLYFTHELPKDHKDLIAPRDGTVDKNGQPNRWSAPLVPFKDIESAANSPTHYVRGKFADVWTAIPETLNNRDFNNHLISHPSDPYWEQMFNRAGHVLGAPIGAQKFMQEKKQGSDNETALLGTLGISRVSKSTTATPAEKKMQEIRASHFGPMTDEELEAREQKDARIAAGNLTRKERQKERNDIRKNRFEKDMEQFSYDQVKQVYDQADDEEKAMMARLLLQKRFARTR